MNETLGSRTRKRGFSEGPAYSGGQIIRVTGGGICKIPTTHYNVVVFECNLVLNLLSFSWGKLFMQIQSGIKKVIVLLIFVFLVFSINGCSPYHQSDKKPKAKFKFNQNSNQNFADAGEFSDSTHPYGNPFIGVLPWETNQRFQIQTAAKKMRVRMAAFQTTLPDPLPGEEYNVALAADLLAGKIIKPGEIFSMNHSVGPYSKVRGFQDGPAYYGTEVIKVTGGGVCKIASTLYNVTTLANLKIIERNPHSMPVPYVPPGQDATVSSSNKDFRFMNDSREPILIWADTKGNTLYIAIYGRRKPPKVIWHHEILSHKPARIFYRKNRNLRPGEERTIIPGADGVVVKSWLTVKYLDGRIENKNLGVDYYNPLPHVIEKG
jgi:vancomycin resistance protein VanW